MWNQRFKQWQDYRISGLEVIQKIFKNFSGINAVICYYTIYLLSITSFYQGLKVGIEERRGECGI